MDSSNQHQVVIVPRHDETPTRASIGQSRTGQASPQPNFAPKKCWICLGVVELNECENAQLKRAFFESTSTRLAAALAGSSNGQSATYDQNEIKLKAFTDRFVLAICKCRKKLAHMSCFNSYIDLKQSGNINIDIFCSQCNLRYSFYYPYNGENSWATPRHTTFVINAFFLKCFFLQTFFRKSVAFLWFCWSILQLW